MGCGKQAVSSTKTRRQRKEWKDGHVIPVLYMLFDVVSKILFDRTCNIGPLSLSLGYDAQDAASIMCYRLIYDMHGITRKDTIMRITYDPA